MAVFYTEHMIIQDEHDSVTMYLNDDGNIFVTNDETDAQSWFFVIKKEDWPEIKAFIDKQLGGMKNPI